MLKAIPAIACMAMAGMLMRSVDESRFVKGPAGRLHVYVRGAGGSPVVFVPSLAGTTRHWEPQLAHLAAARKVVAVDLRGHGRSDPPASSAYAPQDFGRDLQAVLDALDISRAVIVGHSMGSAAALAFASEHFGEGANGFSTRSGDPAPTPVSQATRWKNSSSW